MQTGVRQMKVNSDYDIGAAFRVIEDELLASMIRNMKRHKAEEVEEGFQWEQWQTLQLESLEKYRQQNRKKFGKQFQDINSRLEAAIQNARIEGNMSQEIAILQAIKKGWKGKKTSGKSTAEFFKLNDRKLNALINATKNDVQKAETAILRMADDQYRKVIFNAQVYVNTGSGTYEKAVDMATKDMLASGLNCVEYANGARHTLADYVDMALRTASKRAYLTGEGEKRQEWGIATVIMNKRGNACPKCVPFVGKVLIDDVWSGGSRKDGSYPLMSTAISAGLYHPRCRDSHTTYFPGISTADDTWSKEELEAVETDYKEEQKQHKAERQVEKFDRLKKNSLDPSNRKKYQLKSDEWKNAIRGSGQNAEWGRLLGVDQQTEEALNAIHNDLGRHMVEHKTEKSVIYSLSEKMAIATDIGKSIDEVVLSRETVKALKTAGKNDIIMAHVHPNNVSFSRADIDNLVTNKSVKALTVECPDGSKFILEKGSYETTLFGYPKYDKAFSEAEREAQSRFDAFINNNSDELEKVWPEYIDARNQLLADKLGMVYKKVK